MPELLKSTRFPTSTPHTVRPNWPLDASVKAADPNLWVCPQTTLLPSLLRIGATMATRRRKVYFSAMTTLVGIQIEDLVILAADSQITEDNLRTISSTTPKIISVGKYLLGLVGDSRPGDILAYNWNPPPYKGADPVAWMGKKVMPSILKAFKENGYEPYEASKDKEAGDIPNASMIFLIANLIALTKSPAKTLVLAIVV